MCYYEFKVIYLKNDITHVDYQESLEKCRQIAHPIDGSVNMQEPKVILQLQNYTINGILGHMMMNLFGHIVMKNLILIHIL